MAWSWKSSLNVSGTTLPNVKQTQSINKMQQTYVNEWISERGSDFENLSARITEIEVTVAKIRALEGFRGKMVFLGGF
jgi:hypothetical protein